ncbi:phosphatase PAP2 family protein [bacterium]|nr:phosphatase PAP2 family protein [bacterium]
MLPNLNLNNRWLFIFLFCWGISAAAPAPAEEQTSCIWSNVGEELLAVGASPLKGAWPDYLLASGIAGGLAIALNNDINWYAQIQDHRTECQDRLMPVAGLLGDGFIHLVGCAALYKFGNEHDRKTAALALEGQVNVAVIALLLKTAFSATRPETENRQRHWFTFVFSNTSFPSGHTMSAFCGAAILGQAYHLEWVTYPLAALVAYSRIYNQRHWPSDVIAGAGLGLLIGHTVLAFHSGQSKKPGIHFSVLPARDGGHMVISWLF